MAKLRVNMSLDQDLVGQARRKGLNMSGLMEQALADVFVLGSDGDSVKDLIFGVLVADVGCDVCLGRCDLDNVDDFVEVLTKGQVGGVVRNRLCGLCVPGHRVKYRVVGESGLRDGLWKKVDVMLGDFGDLGDNERRKFLSRFLSTLSPTVQVGIISNALRPSV